MIKTPWTLVPLSATRRCLASLVALAAVGCAVLQSPNSVTLSESDLQRLVQRHFPIERRLAEVFEVTVSAPQLKLLPEDNRVATALDVVARDRLFGGQWRGRLALDSALRYEQSDQSVRLAKVRVQSFSLDVVGAPASVGAGGSAVTSPSAQVQRLGALLAERVLEDFTVYRVPPERAAQLLRAGVTPGAVTVGPRGVEITLAPITR